jgi:thiosulfate dehydrogenase [quinone] large subunit
LSDKTWFQWTAGSFPPHLTHSGFRKLALALLAFVIVFNVGTYNYYRGSVLTPFHGGPVSPSMHHLTLSEAVLVSDGGLRFHVYLDGGTPAAPAHIVAVELLNADKQSVADWNAATLSKLPQAAFQNDYVYNRFVPGTFGIEAKMGAAATLTLPAPPSGTSAGASYVQLTDVGGRSFTAKLAP